MLKFLAGLITGIAICVAILFFGPFCCYYDAMGEKEQINRSYKTVTMTVGYDPDLSHPSIYRQASQIGYINNRVILITKDKDHYAKLVLKLRNLR